MAEKAVMMWHAKKIYMTYGTKYHVSEKAEDYEYSIAKRLGAEIEGRLYLNIEGMIFDIRHKIGTSSVPHGRHTALAREVLWDLVDQAKDLGPKIDVVIRSHCHYHVFNGDACSFAMTLPGLQFKRGRFGSREMSGTIDWGAIRWTVHKGEKKCEEKEILQLTANKPRIFTVR
jgi:hypothetical protein